MKNAKKYEYRPQGWQLDPSHIDSKKVQFWKNGIMVTAQMEKIAAQELVSNGNAFVITGQAIGAMVDGISIA